MLLVGWAEAGYAGVFSDDLSRCLVNNTNSEDRSILMRWMVFSYAFHPANIGVVSVDLGKKDLVDRSMGELVERLLVADCKSELVQALNYEGASAIESSFQTLGQIAAQDILKEKTVNDAAMGFLKYMDESQFQGLLK